MPRTLYHLPDSRRLAQLRQVDVAKRVGWPRVYRSRYKNRERTLGVAEYVQVARAIRVDPVTMPAAVHEEADR